MRVSHLHWIVASLLLLSGCGARSPYDDDEEYCEVPASGGTTLGFGGNTYRGGTTSTSRGGTTWFTGGTTSYGARGGYGGSYGGVGGYGGTNTGGRGGSGGIVAGGPSRGGAGGYAGAPRGGGTAGRGGGGGVAGKGGFTGNGGSAAGCCAWPAGAPNGGAIAGNTGLGGTGMAGSGPGGSSSIGGSGIAGGVNVGGNGDGGIMNVGGMGNGGVTNGGVTNGGVTNGVAGATAGTSPGGAGPWPGCVCSQPNCGTCPTTTVTVDRGSYFIDATETTNAEYSMFLAANVPIASQPAVCSWNLTFVPNVNWPLIGKDDMPVTWVDWCDAFAYCAWAGKRLCGAVGGGTAAFAESDNPGMNQWFDACTTGGTSIYPYGATYDATACNGADYGAEALVAVGTMPNCKTPTGISDMSGNAYEWEDSCGNWTGETDVCHTRGGSYFTSDPNILRCRTASTLYTRNSVRSSIGFRCCADK